MVAGTGRSGTTWLADIFGALLPSRIMFEPFHCDHIREFSNFHYFHYARPSEPDDQLLAYCRTVFSGSIRHEWIDRGVSHLFPKYRVIKEIRANLFLKWIRNHFPELPLFFVIRHPCAVVLSRMHLDWATDLDIAPFLAQEKLIDDYLRDKQGLIECARTLEEKHAVVWCVSNLVPLTQFRPHELNIVFYEHLCMRPEKEIERIHQFLRHGSTSSELRDTEKALRRIDMPSGTTRKTSAVMTGEDKIGRWRSELSPRQIASILGVVEGFGLQHLYGDSNTPLSA